MIYDVAIIGAGIVGASIARTLAQYKLSVCMIEKENDVSCGTSKANSGIIHAGYDPEPHTLMAKLNSAGNALFETLSQELHFDFKRVGSLVVAFCEEEILHLEVLKKRGDENGVPGLKIIYQDELRKIEPNINEEVLAALYAPSAGIISPYQATWAIAENAVQNGVRLFLNTEVRGIEKNDKDVFVIKSASVSFCARYVVNAAGLFSDEINRMAKARRFKILPRHGEYCLLDNRSGRLVNHVVFQTPNELGKGVLVTPTVDENILIGPSADDFDDKLYTGTSMRGQNYVLDTAEKSVPQIPRRDIINSFSGIRAIALDFVNEDDVEKTKPVGDFIIEEDSQVAHFITVAGISSPGLTCAPAIGEYVKDLLQKSGLPLTVNTDFIKIRKGIENFMRASLERKTQLIEINPLYGRIICRCEMISEAEIVGAIKSVVGANDLDGIKRRTRAGMGRCQGGFCSPRVTEIMSREKNIPMNCVTKNGGCSYILCGETRTRDTLLRGTSVREMKTQRISK